MRHTEVVRDDRIDRALGPLLGTFVGDTLGVAYEGAAGSAIPARLDMVEAHWGGGTYTDDTQVKIVVTDCPCDFGELDVQRLQQMFVAAYDPRRRYGSGTRTVLELIGDGVPAEDAAAGARDGRGSMRIAPVAVHTTRRRCLEVARRSARVTRIHPIGTDAAVGQAATIGAPTRAIAGTGGRQPYPARWLEAHEDGAQVSEEPRHPDAGLHVGKGQPVHAGVFAPVLSATRFNAANSVAGSQTKLNRSSNLRPGSEAAQW
ncbi:ADP-ribosylglycohydrolase family protein [Mycobacterium intracellulare]|uniref:ADP-ribosylglycohydrolase family protein n=1 Tax=Mycobacterium intracellulare TaxID=1767 RepID=UPI002491B040|nr:ADP-ribosylglycohydrolase family protein [Mycobacterium intracellulare]